MINLLNLVDNDNILQMSDASKATVYMKYKNKF